MISFFLNFEPDIPKTTHQVGIRAGINKQGKPFLYKDSSYRSLESLFASKMIPFVPDIPFDKDISLYTLWMFNSSKSDGVIRHRNRKPDTDNLIKGLKDAMTECGFWNHDEHVVKETVEKIDVPSNFKHGVYVWITTISTTDLETATRVSTTISRLSGSLEKKSEDALKE